MVEIPEAEPEKFKTHEVKRLIESSLSKIATDSNIEKCMRDVPDSAWNLVKTYLGRRYPDGGEKAYYRIEDKLMKENNAK